MQRFSVAREAIIKNGDLRRPDITKDKDIDTTFLMPYSWLQTRKNRPKSARNHTVFLMVFIREDRPLLLIAALPDAYGRRNRTYHFKSWGYL